MLNKYGKIIPHSLLIVIIVFFILDFDEKFMLDLKQQPGV